MGTAPTPSPRESDMGGGNQAGSLGSASTSLRKHFAFYPSTPPRGRAKETTSVLITSTYMASWTNPVPGIWGARQVLHHWTTTPATSSLKSQTILNGRHYYHPVSWMVKTKTQRSEVLWPSLHSYHVAEPRHLNPKPQVNPCPTINASPWHLRSWHFSHHSSSNICSWVASPHNSFPLASWLEAFQSLTHHAHCPELQICLSLAPLKNFQSSSTMKTVQNPYKVLKASPPNWSSHPLPLAPGRDTQWHWVLPAASADS